MVKFRFTMPHSVAVNREHLIQTLDGFPAPASPYDTIINYTFSLGNIAETLARLRVIKQLLSDSQVKSETNQLELADTIANVSQLLQSLRDLQ